VFFYHLLFLRGPRPLVLVVPTLIYLLSYQFWVRDRSAVVPYISQSSITVNLSCVRLRWSSATPTVNSLWVGVPRYQNWEVTSHGKRLSLVSFEAKYKNSSQVAWSRQKCNWRKVIALEGQNSSQVAWSRQKCNWRKVIALEGQNSSQVAAKQLSRRCSSWATRDGFSDIYIAYIDIWRGTRACEHFHIIVLHVDIYITVKTFVITVILSTKDSATFQFINHSWH
jgi:hypothetical protein